MQAEMTNDVLLRKWDINLHLSDSDMFIIITTVPEYLLWPDLAVQYVWNEREVYFVLDCISRTDGKNCWRSILIVYEAHISNANGYHGYRR